MADKTFISPPFSPPVAAGRATLGLRDQTQTLSGTGDDPPYLLTRSQNVTSVPEIPRSPLRRRFASFGGAGLLARRRARVKVARES